MDSLSAWLFKTRYLVGVLSLWTLTPVVRADDTIETPDCSRSNLTPDQKLQCLFPTEESLIEGSPQGSSESGPTNLPHGNLFTDFYPFIINTLLATATTLIFVAFLYAGYLLVFTNNKEENIEQGKKTITYAIIGAFVAAISYAMIYGIANLDLD